MKSVLLASMSVLLLLFIFTSSAMAATPAYTITDLGTFRAAPEVTTEAAGLNDSGQVVGYSNDRAFLHNGTSLIKLGTFGGTISRAHAINNSGQVVGEAYMRNNYPKHAFVYDGTSMKDLGTLGGTYSVAYDINNHGQIVGESNQSAGGQRAFLYEGTTMKSIGTLGGNSSIAYAINDHGQIVGSSNSHAFLYDGTSMKDLGTLGGTASWAKDINNHGHIVGGSYTSDKGRHAFLSDGITMTDLGTIDDTGGYYYANAINDNGQIVGFNWNIGSSYGARPFLYEAGSMVDLNTLIDPDSSWKLNFAFDINASGQISGTGSFDGVSHAFLLTPIPEPASIALLAIGGIALLRKRQ